MSSVGWEVCLTFLKSSAGWEACLPGGTRHHQLSTYLPVYQAALSHTIHHCLVSHSHLLPWPQEMEDGGGAAIAEKTDGEGFDHMLYVQDEGLTDSPSSFVSVLADTTQI